LCAFRLVVPDARSEAVRNRIAAQVAKLDPASERDALLWIEAVSEFDADAERRGNPQHSAAGNNVRE